MNNKRIKTGVRLRDVATAAGVSSATVSAVVNGRAQQYGICQATQEKVQGLIRQMGYSPSLAAFPHAYSWKVDG
jgi:DNA-binding LacI/PurR family transcriptional regulator